MSNITGGAVSIHSYERVSRERAELRKKLDALTKAGNKLGKLAERICVDYAPTQALLRELDDARMDWDAASKKS